MLCPGCEELTLSLGPILQKIYGLIIKILKEYIYLLDNKKTMIRLGHIFAYVMQLSCHGMYQKNLQ